MNVQMFATGLAWLGVIVVFVVARIAMSRLDKKRD